MTMLIGQMLACLIVAAGIGGAVGWLLRHLSAGPLAQQIFAVTTTLRLKDQALEKLQYDCEVKTSAIQTLESKMIASEARYQSTQQELSSRHERMHALQMELAATTQQLSALEAGQAALLDRIRDSETTNLEQTRERLESHDALEVAQQALMFKEQELRSLQERLAVSEHQRAEIDRLRARILEMEPAQGRVHWLEVQLSERDTQHRTALHEIERQLAEQDRKIEECVRLRQQLREQEAAGSTWKVKYTQAVEQATDEVARSQNIRSQLDHLQNQLTIREQGLKEKDQHIDTLQRQIAALESVQKELAGQAHIVDEKEEEIGRLRKRLVEVRAALRIRTDDSVAPRPVHPTGNQLSLQIGHTKPSPALPKDDLKEIRGIGPAFERVLNNLGIVTFRQVAQWDAAEMHKVAAKLATAPDRIKRDKWIVSAKKLHEQKYGKHL